MRTWVTQALTAGGILKVRQAMPNKTILRAYMSWPGEKTISGQVSLSVDGALDNLEEALIGDDFGKVLRPLGELKDQSK